MCNCCRDSSVVSAFDRPKMSTEAQRVVSLLKGDVFLVILDSEWTVVFDHASNANTLSEFRGHLARMQTTISGCEDAIRQLNTGWRIDELVSFKLTCQASRIFVFLLPQTYRLVIIHRFDEETPEDGPDVDQTLRAIAREMGDSIYVLSAPHNP